jgi:hypothetical protein
LFRSLHWLSFHTCFRFHKPLRRIVERTHGVGSVSRNPRTQVKRFHSSPINRFSRTSDRS